MSFPLYLSLLVSGVFLGLSIALWWAGEDKTTNAIEKEKSQKRD